MDRFSLIEIDTPAQSEQIATFEAPAEQIVKAEAQSGNWGDSSFHNLTEGARASGNVQSAHSLLASADLNWDPEFRALITIEGHEVASDVGRAVVRSDSGKAIGIVGSKYQIIPHRRLADLADALVGANGSLRYGNAGHKHNGAQPFIQLKGSTRTVGQDVRGADVDVSDVITLITSHDGTLNASACYSANVIVCDNTFAHALSTSRQNGMRIPHLPRASAQDQDVAGSRPAHRQGEARRVHPRGGAQSARSVGRPREGSRVSEP